MSAVGYETNRQTVIERTEVINPAMCFTAGYFSHNADISAAAYQRRNIRNRDATGYLSFKAVENIRSYLGISLFDFIAEYAAPSVGQWKNACDLKLSDVKERELTILMIKTAIDKGNVDKKRRKEARNRGSHKKNKNRI